MYRLPIDFEGAEQLCILFSPVLLSGRKLPAPIFRRRASEVAFGAMKNK